MTDDTTIGDTYGRTTVGDVTITVYARDGRIMASLCNGNAAKHEVLDHNPMNTVGRVDWAAYLDQAKGLLT